MDKVKTLPDSMLGSALAYQYALGMEHDRAWVRFIFREKPEMASQIMEDFWRAYLARDCKHIPGLYGLSREEIMGDVARRKAVSLLRDFPNCKELEDLLRAGWAYGDWSDIQKIAVDVLSRRNAVRGNQRVLWYGVAFLFNPREFAQG